MQLRVELRDITPPIWRRLVVPAECTLDVVHEILQIAFGWTDSHLHGFEVGAVHFGMSDIENELLIVDECFAPLGGVASKGDTFVYEYDFGDGWEHDVLVEEVNEETMEVRVECLDGARAGPPEDCGGPPATRNGPRCASRRRAGRLKPLRSGGRRGSPWSASRWWSREEAAYPGR